MKKRRPKILVRLNNSALPLVNGWRPAERDPATDLDDPTALVTGDFQVRDKGWKANGVVTIEQDLPFRTEVLAIFGHLQLNEF
jgi:hypothetical protein